MFIISKNEIMKIVFGVLCLVSAGFVIILIILPDMLIMLAMLSIALGLLSVFLTYDAKVEKEKTLQEEKRRKLTMMNLENESNLDLLEKLKVRIEELYPSKLMKKKLKQPYKQKHSFTPEELKQILKGKVWIQKQHCSYYYALQVAEIGHYFENTFIETIKESTKKLDDLNQQKDFIQWWIISRGFHLNADEIKNLYVAIDEAMKITKKMKEMVATEIEKNTKGIK